MADRVKALTVVLDRDIRIDDVEPLMAAISCMKGVRKVTPEVSDVSAHVAETRARQRVLGKLYVLIEELRG